MSADFWAGYVSGAIGIAVGNPLDILKTKLQAGSTHGPSLSPQDVSSARPSSRWTSYLRGAAAPILGYGALNALLFVTYNRSLSFLSTGSFSFSSPPALEDAPAAWELWTAGALGGLATFFVSAPTELVKCRAQVSKPPQSSWNVAKDLWRELGLRGLYVGGAVTSVRDAVGYGFYFWSYELSKRAVSSTHDSHNQEATKVLLCGGLAGVVTWASIFPLDMLKTRVQTWDFIHRHHLSGPSQPLLGASTNNKPSIFSRPSTFHIAREAYTNEGVSVFFRGLGVCSARAFVVNAVQWAVYEYMMKLATVRSNGPELAVV